MNLRLKIPVFLGLLGLFCLLLPNTATADSFDWTYQGTMLNISPGILDSGSGELTITNGVITGLSGTFNGLAIASIVPPGGLFGNDNLTYLFFLQRPFMSLRVDSRFWIRRGRSSTYTLYSDLSVLVGHSGVCAFLLMYTAP